MAKSQCYGCTERYVGCHSKCESYKEFKSKHDEEMRVQREAREKESRFMDLNYNLRVKWLKIRKDNILYNNKP